MMGILPDWFEQHWPNYPHERLYAMVRTEARGVGEVEATAEEMAEFTKLMNESVEDVEQALAEAGVSWQGLAAESMNTGVSPLAQWARDAVTATEASADSTNQVGESFGYVANAMPEPVPTPDRMLTFPPTAAELVAAQRDQDATERAAQEAKQRAVELMDTYSGNSANAVDTLGAFVPPQGVAVATPEPSADSAGSASGSIEGSGGSGRSDPDGPEGGGDPSGGYAVERVDPKGDAPPDATPPGPVPPGSGSGTDPSQVTTPSAPNHVTPVAGPAPGNPAGPPVTSPAPMFAGGPTGGGLGRGPGGGGPGGGRGAGGAPGGGRVAGGAPERVPGRGGAIGTGPVAGEPVAGARGGVNAAARGVGTPGYGPMGAGQRGEEDKERTSPEYLRDFRDDFWDDTPPVAPPVIGEDDD